MLYRTPAAGGPLADSLKELDDLRAQLGTQIAHSTRWMGTLRRQVKASAFGSSTAIEGFSVPSQEAVALITGTRPDPRDEDRMALACYGWAMDHVSVMAGDPAFRWLDRVILDLHFDACSFQPGTHPGLWRTGPVGVTGRDGSVVYRGPEAQLVPELMTAVTDWLEQGDRDAHVVIRAAMAHLHVVSVHPFEDGNGRIARIVQSLTLARDGLVSPEFGSIEEYLGRHTDVYYASLEQVQGGGYRPDRDASDWVRFCVEAHLAQARQRLAQIERAAARWSFLEEQMEGRGWPERLVIAVEQSLMGGSDRAAYREEADISPATASADFRRLLDAGFVVQRGRGRNVRYLASPELRRKVDDRVGGD